MLRDHTLQVRAGFGMQQPCCWGNRLLALLGACCVLVGTRLDLPMCPCRASQVCTGQLVQGFVLAVLLLIVCACAQVAKASYLVLCPLMQA